MMEERNKINKEKKSMNTNSFFFGLFINFFQPSAYIKSISDIDLNKLKEQGIKLIICDLDNTLVPHFTKFPTKFSINFVKQIKEKGFEFILISNNTSKRVSFFSEKLGLDNYISNAKKPFTKVIKKTLNKYDYTAQEIVLIGDMLITDVLVSNFLNLNSILVQPLFDSDVGWNKIIAWMEKTIFKKLSKKNLLVSSSDFEKNEILSENYEIL